MVMLTIILIFGKKIPSTWKKKKIADSKNEHQIGIDKFIKLKNLQVSPLWGNFPSMMSLPHFDIY